jgi:trehalose 6-phosphate phosphatase
MTTVLRPPARPGLALFLDVDGTLMDLAPAPDEARLRPDTVPLLKRAVASLDGALALVSGRSIAQIDSLVWPLQLPVAGVHGLERRDAHGERLVHATAGSLDPARHLLQQFVDSIPGLLLEDKTLGIAIHYRRVPDKANDVLAAVAAAARQLNDSASVQTGDMVVEIKAGPRNKASAVAEFMQEAPFTGRIPAFVGDDVTDQDALHWVAEKGGFAIAVGTRVAGNYRLDGCSEVASWIEELIAANGGENE